MDPFIIVSFVVILIIVILVYIMLKRTKIKELLKTYKRKEGMVKDLAEKYKKGEVSAKEIKKEVLKRRIVVDTMATTPMSMLTYFIGFGGLFLHILPITYIYFNEQPFLFLPSVIRNPLLDFLNLFQSIEISPIIICVAIIISIALSPLMIISTQLRKNKGGCKSEEHTVVLIKEGPYGIIRNPTHFTVLFWIITILIVASPWLHFTYLSIISVLLIIIAFYIMEFNEEKFDQMKWGDEYRQYMKEVPRWNLIKGLWILRKRKNKKKRIKEIESIVS